MPEQVIKEAWVDPLLSTRKDIQVAFSVIAAGPGWIGVPARAFHAPAGPVPAPRGDALSGTLTHQGLWLVYSSRLEQAVKDGVLLPALAAGVMEEAFRNGGQSEAPL